MECLLHCGQHLTGILSFHPPDKSGRQVSLLFLFSPDEETEAFTRLHSLHKDTQSVSSGARTWTQMRITPNLLNHHVTAPRKLLSESQPPTATWPWPITFFTKPYFMNDICTWIPPSSWLTPTQMFRVVILLEGLEGLGGGAGGRKQNPHMKANRNENQ